MSQKRGLPEDASLGVKSRRSQGLVSALQAVKSGVVEVDLSRVSTNPENPAPRMTTKIEELASSIQAQGLIHPLTVCSVKAYLGAHPEYADSFSDVDYVMLDGDRRRVAALLAGVDMVPVIVRDDLASDPDGVRLATALQRLELTPIQEALAYQRKAANGLSHAAIAAAAGVSQGQVTKRLKLLRLPESIQVAIETGVYPVVEGLNLLKEDDAVVARTGDLVARAVDQGDLILGPVDDGDDEATSGAGNSPAAIDRQVKLPYLASKAKEAIRSEDSSQQARTVAEDLGVPYVDDPGAEFKRPYDHVVHNPADIPALVAAGDLIVAPALYRAGGVGYFQRSAPRRSIHNADEQRARERVKTRKLRRPFLEELLDLKPSAGQLREAMVALAFDTIVDSQARKLAARRWSEKNPKTPIDYYDLASLSPTPDRVMVAWWVYLYALDVRLGATSVLSDAECDYLQSLVKVGYEPSPAEREAIQQFLKAQAKENDR